MGRDAFPSEEEQYREYKSIAEKVFPNKVIMRTFDIGGDKVIAHSTRKKIPFSGRGIRGLRSTARNISRAGARNAGAPEKNIWVMSLVSQLKEVRRAKSAGRAGKRVAACRKVAFDDAMEDRRHD